MAQVLRAYGLRVQCPLPVPGALPDTKPPDVVVTLADSLGTLADAWSGPGDDALVDHRWVDGRPLDYHRGRDGDTLLRWGEDGAWLVDEPRATVVGYAPDDPPAAAWERVLLDSVLASVALGRGAEALHAGVVAVGASAIAILGATGAGKTSLVAALLARGHTLVADDIAVLTELEGAPAVWPAPPVISLAAGSAPNGSWPEIGTELARLGDESWLHVSRAATAAVPLRAIVALERTEDAIGAPALVTDDQPFRLLFGHLMNSSGDSERGAERLGQVAALAAGVDVRRLVAPRDGAPPDALAAALEVL